MVVRLLALVSLGFVNNAGAGAAYTYQSNVSLTSGASIGIQIGAGGTSAGTGGADTIFDTTNNTVVAAGGGSHGNPAYTAGQTVNCTPSGNAKAAETAA